MTQEDLTPRYIKYGLVDVNDDGEPDAYDGDSVRLRMDLGHGVWIDDGMLYRLAGIQAPENPEHGVGKRAKEYLQMLIVQYQLNLTVPTSGGYWLVVKTIKKKGDVDYRPKEKKGSFGRYLVVLYGKDEECNWINLNNEMLLSQHAKEYTR
jgi:endonuclease YncB( thermonuclease family)